MSFYKLRHEGVIPMLLTTDTFLAILSFGLGCFAVGYALGTSHANNKK